MAVYLIHLTSLLSAAFTLGGTAVLYLLHRTRILNRMMLFLLSLFLISLRFFMTLNSPDGSDSITGLLSFAGVGVNIAVLPYLLADIVQLQPSAVFKRIHQGWCTLFVLAGLSFFLFPGFFPAQLMLLIQQTVTIAASLAVLGIRMRKFKKSLWYKPMIHFFQISLVFMVLLIADILTSLLELNFLAPFDNLSVPVYLSVLSIGIFYFSYRHLSRAALMSGPKLTESCRKYYSLTQRETEIIEQAVKGMSNREIADELGISAKTVENHLYNIYQKFDVGSRQQLVSVLNSWKSE